MRDYVALVERLREARKHIWTQPQIELYPIMYEAADAIEELVGFIQQSERDRDGGMNDGRLIDAVIEAPTVDAVPVVRCRDCRFYEEGLRYDGSKCMVCGIYPFPMSHSPNDYCSHGERKGDE